MKNTIVSAEWLKENKQAKHLVILDASITGNVSGFIPVHVGLQIVGARPLSLKSNFSKADAPFPNTLPEPAQFETEAQKLGVCENSLVVIYDNIGVYSSPRAWWLFKSMGHENTVVLNGGLTAWIEAGGETEPVKNYSGAFGNFRTHFKKEAWRNLQDIENNLNNKEECVLDARSEGRFRGTAPEPREGLSSGSIPYSKNLPFKKVLKKGKIRSKSELEVLFKTLTIKKQGIVFSCGSGLTACINLLAVSMVLENPLSVYDGSWTEWAQLRPKLIEK